MEDRSSLARRLTELPADQREALRKRLEEKAGPGKTIPRRDPSARVPLSFGQQRLWVVEQLLEGRPAYNQGNTIRMHAAVDVDALRRAVNEIIRRHEILRTTFPATGGEPSQQVSPFLAIDIPLVDLRQVEAAGREAEALRLAAESAAVPFDLQAGPLIRGTLYRLQADDHLFALTLHHIVCDGWSLGVFAAELSVIYASYVLGREHPFPEPTLQYGDFAVWQRRHFGGDGPGAQLEYWRSRLAGLRPLDLPADRPRPARPTHGGARVPVAVEGALFRSLTALAEEHNTTLHVLLLTALFALAHRYTGETDLALGIPVGGRTRRELEPLIGFFVNTQVIRADLSGDPPFVELLAQVRDLCYAAIANQDVPFERLVEEFWPARDRSRSPLAQVLFQVFQVVAPGQRREQGFVLTPISAGTSKFDLEFELTAHPDGVRGHAEYSTDLFGEERIRRLVAHWTHLLADIVQDPSRPVSRLELMTDEERRLLARWNDTAAPYPRDSNLPAEFRRAAQAHAERTAVEFGGASLTYAQLEARAAAVAARLVGLGVRPGDAVGLLMERRLELPAAMLGIMATGAFYVPLDPRTPASYLAYQVADAGVRAAVATAKHAALLPELACVLADQAGEAEAPFAGPEIPPTAAAWLLYTSGTTGRPKGVPVPHRAALRLVHGVDPAVTPDDRLLQFAPLSFDASVLEIWMALLNGATLVIHPPGTPSLEELGAFIRDGRLTWVWLTTALFRQMVEHRAGDLRRVRQIFTGGEVLSPAVAQEAWKALPRTRIANAYGPTECATFATTFPLTSAEAVRDVVPIGRPLRNTTVHLLDGYGNPTPPGVPGEICIGGDAVAPGYWNRPELTRERFVPDPWNPGGTLYRTGDLGRHRPDGVLEFLGRRDRQVKVRGFRIEPGEIETALASHPDVSGAAVLMLEQDGDKRLAAFAETLPGRALGAAELRAHLAGLLPRHMMPSHLEAVERLPLTPSGKVDAAELTRRAASAADDGEEHAEPATALERLLAAMWTELLHVPRAGATDDFFALGGHSLIATRLLSRIRETFQRAVTMREFFDDPTIRGLASLLATDEQAVRRAELLVRLGSIAAPSPQPAEPPLAAAAPGGAPA